MIALLLAVVLTLAADRPKEPKPQAHLVVSPMRPYLFGPVDVTATAWMTHPGPDFWCAELLWELFVGEEVVAGDEPIRTSKEQSDCDPYALQDEIPERISFMPRFYRFGREAGDHRLRVTFRMRKKSRIAERVLRIR